MSNHASFIDAFVVPPALQGEYTAIVAAENFKIPLLWKHSNQKSKSTAE